MLLLQNKGNNMTLLKELDIRVIGIRPNGKERKERYALFECPICTNHIEIAKSRGLRMKTCVNKDCLHKQKSATLTTHEMTKDPMYRTWSSMKQRCNNKKNPSYMFYGAKGITYDPRWEQFECFLADMSSTHQKGLELDRINNKGNYSKGNCQWLDKATNASKNKLKAVGKYSLDGEILLETYPSAKAAAEAEGYTNQHGITRCARGERTRYLNHIWKWV